MTGRGGVSEAVVVVLLAVALFAVFFGAFLVVPLVVVIVGVLALAISQRRPSDASRKVESRPAAQDDPPSRSQPSPAPRPGAPSDGRRSDDAGGTGAAPGSSPESRTGRHG